MGVPTVTDTHTKAVAVIEHEPTTTLNPALRAIMERDLPTETVREMLQIQREWEAGEARKAYTTAMVALKQVLPTVLKRDKSVAFKQVRYTHLSLAGMMDAVTGPLTTHGFSLGWEPSTDAKAGVSVTCRLTHAQGHSETCTIAAPIDTSGSKSTAQGVASTITLLQRYTALSLLGIATADMREPAGPPDPDHVDSERNLRAVAKLRALDRSAADAEAYIGKKVSAWTSADLESLGPWARGEMAEADEWRDVGPPPLTDDDVLPGDEGAA